MADGEAGSRKLLNAEEFQQGLAKLDTEMGKDPILSAFAPIKIITAGGFVAVSYLKSRKSTDDIDYLLDPEWAQDEDIKRPLRGAMEKVAHLLHLNKNWINEDMALFVTRNSREYLFRKAEEQNIILWEGTNLCVMAAPMEWALERKLRRIHHADRGRKTSHDMQDAIAMLKHLRDKNGGPLDRTYIAGMNVNAFDVLPDATTMDRVEAEYQRTFNEKIFR
ncbi:hypothetical protein CIRG_04184 [Coccidioides immitis RMSCC 2394]|uniref:DUF7582 domain-containing protein n=1 Tax=Coccidioides immitis RMSCC 2394 TaxID=404692 RepID=A0A0J6YCF6_COCIT|nr:hypothetical protein CIRG_04184 [Coccidioides immitis RMSCC 2394]